MSDEKNPAERLSSLEERMKRLEVRMDAVVKQIKSLRKDLDGHFDEVNERLDNIDGHLSGILLALDPLEDIALLLKKRLLPPDTGGHTPAFVPGDED